MDVRCLAGSPTRAVQDLSPIRPLYAHQGHPCNTPATSFSLKVRLKILGGGGGDTL